MDGPSFHSRMMNIPDGDGEFSDHHAYRVGHRDARHAAAEIALEADTLLEEKDAELRRFRDIAFLTVTSREKPGGDWDGKHWLIQDRDMQALYSIAFHKGEVGDGELSRAWWDIADRQPAEGQAIEHRVSRDDIRRGIAHCSSGLWGYPKGGFHNVVTLWRPATTEGK